MYARNGDWTKCLALAEKHSPKMLPHYLVPPPHVCRVAEKLIEQKLRENFFACWIDFQCSFRVTEFEALMYLQARFSEISRTNNDTELQ